MNKHASLASLLISAVAGALILATSVQFAAAARATARVPEKIIYPKVYAFADPRYMPMPMDVTHDADGSIRLVLKGLTIPRGQMHMFGFHTVYPIPIPAGIKSVTISVTFAVKQAPVSPPYMARSIRIPRTCAIQLTHKELSDPSRMFARRAPTYGDYGSLAQVESFRVTLPARDLGSHVPSTMLKVFHKHQPNNKRPCLDVTTVVVKEFKIIFHSIEQPAWYGKLMAMGDTGRAIDEDDDGDEDAFDEYGGAYSVDEAFGDGEYVGCDE
ncbi:hypothetical protein AMAG_02482 [Allomyces macrogynus ATCC 38327]|uniref:Uncharacterized protein n=1 Tax=Allomyces macrogynus (strain ATCC 38327) TaxID=578462 RepID=A0A0L0S2S1_ALLM3|nr:hypothetical protein AMAG_02482 [Allomyces macrogynus ATCC 38327]|eukprot:KNE56700.1 hypothetical protein AMAG_02482 [Allomyces macrogynus ATCC 38327]